MSDEMISLGAKLAQLAQLKPDAPAVTCGETTLTYEQFHRLSNRAARGLAAKGVKFGDLVTLGLPNSTDFAVACWAIWKLGATPQPISFRLPKGELEAIMELAKTPVVIAQFDHQIDRPLLSIPDLLSLSDDDSDLPDAIAPVSKAPTSGGSTGRPKLILSGQPGVTAKETPEVGGWRLKPGSVALLPAPLYHNAGFGMMMSAFSVGCHMVLMPRFEAEATLAEIARNKATWVYLVPTMMNRIWHLPEEVRGKYDLSSLETLWHLAAPCPAWLKEAFIRWVGPETVMELYAGTEAQAVTTISGAEWLEHRGSVGKVTVGEMVAVGEDGSFLPPREVGEIYMRRPEGAPPSYKYIGATAKVLEGGWESLGDIGWFDEDGYLYLADRRTDMILVGGSNVYPAEIEAALEEHPEVQSCAVIGFPDDDLGNKIHAIVQTKGSRDEASLRAHLAARLVTYKQPRTYEFVDEPLRDDAGKVRRSALRDERLAAQPA
ncbi:AMP-binding protein [Phenylobacterium sp. NIBR 498073]|uniref:AMP-binding protein n=1 Tax=Phenylobacterium sp. NIBR 498073 TaxID=3015177 RepID=UPI0022B3BFB3|nr:AMP-binding protein [Phenylobacterium sp. NIBR 498073]MBS0489817.1 AMP-binding protein [Pseudomonadota bacterium]WGU40007.1 AMP-binding protein [Phenylobacterium sp. NIBR 498073]